MSLSMLAPRFFLRRTAKSVHRASYVCPSCQHRAQSSSSLPPKPPQNGQSEHILESIQQTSGHVPQSRQDLQQQMLLDQAYQQQTVVNNGPLYNHRDPRQVHGIAPIYPQAKSNQRPESKDSKADAYDRPFHPSVAAFVTGLSLGIASAAFLYVFSGAYRVVNNAAEDRKILAKRRLELFGSLASASGPLYRSFDERKDWFERVAKNYAAFVPSTHVYLAATLPDIDKAVRSDGKDGKEKVDEIIRSCAEELRKSSIGGSADLMVGREAWRIVHEHLERIVELAEEGRNVPPEIRQRVEKRLEGLRKIGTRVGRNERRALEEEEQAKMAASR